MKKLLFIIPLGITLFSSACSDVETHKKESNNKQVDQNIKRINKDVNVIEFSELINNGEGQILDVRTPDEWATGTIKGAIKMNFYDDDFNKQLEKLDKNKPVYVYCKSGGRSGNAASEMDKMGFTAIYNLVGGIGAWDDAGKEKVK